MAKRKRMQIVTVPTILEQKLFGTPITYAPMVCDQCQMLSINGVPCHETGCPNMSARWDAESGEWIKQRKCFDCGCTVDAEDPCCSEPMEEEEN
jgi:hypothetical protein